MATRFLPLSTSQSASSLDCWADRNVSTSTASRSPWMSVAVLVTHARCSLPAGIPCVELPRFLVRSFHFSSDMDILQSLRLLAPSERQRVDAGAKRWKRIIGQLDSVREVGRKEHQRLLGGVAVGDHRGDADHAEVHGLAIVGPDQGAVVRRVAGVGELDDQAKADRAARKTRLQLFDKKVGGLLLGIRLAQVVLTCNWKKPVASRSLHSL